MFGFVRRALISATLVALSSAAHAVDMRGAQFITTMDGNSLSGATGSGRAFNLYVLPGGMTTYADAAGHKATGTWRLETTGSICVRWSTRIDVMDGCLQLSLDGREVSWDGEDISSRGVLRGGV